MSSSPCRHPLLGVNRDNHTRHGTSTDRSRRNHPTFYVSSATPSPALNPRSVIHSPLVVPLASTSTSTSKRHRRRSEGYAAAYDAPSTDPTYPTALPETATSSGPQSGSYHAHTRSVPSNMMDRPDTLTQGHSSPVDVRSHDRRTAPMADTAQTSPSVSRRASTSLPFGPHRGSRASLAALRAALQEYQVDEPRTPERRPRSHPLNQSSSGEGQTGVDVEIMGTVGMGRAGRSMSTLDLKSAVSGGLGPERMDALVEIHRVLYRGSETRSKEEGWEKQSAEVKRVVERWFEADCAYDHPLVRISSRQSFLSHFILLHLLSSLSIPSLTPSSVFSLALNLPGQVRDGLFGLITERQSVSRDVESLEAERARLKRVKGKAREAGVLSDEWLERVEEQATASGGSKSIVSPKKRSERWWRIWDVTAACKEIGGMECYDGYHLALIDHTITLTLFPSLSNRRNTDSLLSLSYSPSLNSLSSLEQSQVAVVGEPAAIQSQASPSFLRRLAGAVADEFEYFLHWDLPISTIVEFNEVGKATHVRDVVDAQDVVEAFVPFAKRLGWITRGLTGFVSSTLGSLALSLTTPSSHVATPHSEKQGRVRVSPRKRSEVAEALAGPLSVTAEPRPHELADQPVPDHDHNEPDTGASLAPPIGLGIDMKSSPSAPLITPNQAFHRPVLSSRSQLLGESVSPHTRTHRHGQGHRQPIRPRMPERITSGESTNSLGLEGVGSGGSGAGVDEGPSGAPDCLGPTSD